MISLGPKVSGVVMHGCTGGFPCRTAAAGTPETSQIRWTEYADGGRSMRTVDGVCGQWTEYADSGQSMRTVDGVWTAYADGGRSADSVCRRWMECGQCIRKVDGVRNDNDKWLWADSEWNGSKWMTVEIDHLESRSHTVTHKVRWAQYSYDFITWRHLVVNRLSFMR